MIPLAVAAAVLAADQASKWLALAALSPGRPVTVIPGIFQLTLVRNPGASFGILPGKAPLLIALALALVAAIAVQVWRQRAPWGLTGLGLGLVLGGAAGNLVDRLRWGTVVDFLDFRVWPVFNLADVGVVAGALLLLWDSLRRPPG